MKVTLVLVNSLLACILLLPSETRSQRDINEQKRLMMAQDYFNGPVNQVKICVLCQVLYWLDSLDCYADWGGAKQTCMNFVKENLDMIAERWKTLPEIELPVDNHLKGLESDPLRKACRLCQDLFKTNALDCYIDRENARQLCDTRFHETLSTTTRSTPEKVPKRDEYFSPENLVRTCDICENLFQIDACECIADWNGARKQCKNMVFEMPNTVRKHWIKHPMNECHLTGNRLTIDCRNRSVTAKYFNGPENLKKICILCQHLFQIDDSDCMMGLTESRQKCQIMVKQMPDRIEDLWNRLIIE